MTRSGDIRRRTGLGAVALVLLSGVAVLAASLGTDARAAQEHPTTTDLEAQVLRGRFLVVTYDCGACHGGIANPAADDWLIGRSTEADAVPFGELRIFPRNLTPDDDTGLGRYSERQIFNAVRYGLRPSETPDVEITSSVPGEGNHPLEPTYLTPAMPWPSFRHVPDQDLRDIAAYLKHGLRPVTHRVPDPGWPEDGWASLFTLEEFGVHPAPPFPTENERDPTPEAAAVGDDPLVPPAPLDRVLRGRELAIAHGCGDCHGGAMEPGMDGWLAGVESDQAFIVDPFRVWPRNLTPDNRTGLGRFSERQIFNALRFGLRPGETADVEITSTVPGEGNFPLYPKYLAVPMPWPAFRHRSDEELWDIVAYLKHGVAPVSRRVPDSEGPPDFWESEYTEANVGAYPLPPFPTARERRPD